MALILAIEPDRHQASQLTAIVRSRLQAELVIEATAERALAALGDRVPDLILTAALLSPKDEAALAGRLRELDAAAAHIHTITIPVLAAPRSRPRISGMLSALRRDKSASSEVDGCDPAVFAEQCATYLAHAIAERQELARTAAADETGLKERIVPAAASAAMPPAPEVDFEAQFSVAEAFNEAAVEERAEEPMMVEQVRDEPQSEPAWDAPAEEPPARPPSFEPAPEQTIGDAVEQELQNEMLAAQTLEHAVEQPILEEPGMQPAVDEHETGQDADESTIYAAAPAGLDVAFVDADRLLEDSPVFEIVAESDAGLQAQGDLGTDEDLDKYIELDLSEFLDEAAPVVADAVAREDMSAADEGAASDWSEAANVPSADERRETAAPEPASVEPEEDDWLEVVAALRRDVERLDATPAAAAKLPQPLKKPLRKGPKGKPIQDEWGFFDPEQCGFAALLAKLDEITASDDPARRRKRA